MEPIVLKDGDLKRLRELMEIRRHHSRECEGHGPLCCHGVVGFKEAGYEIRKLLPELLDEVERWRDQFDDLCHALKINEELATKERDEARGNAELFRAGAYKLEELVTTRNKERDEARAEVRQLRAELHAARIAEPDSEAYRQATGNWQDMAAEVTRQKAHLHKYGEHKWKCAVSVAIRNEKLCPPCDCGWQELIGPGGVYGLPWKKAESIYGDDGPHTKKPVEFELAGATMRVSATDAIAPSTLRTRYRVECLTCDELIHEATTSATIRCEQHLKDAHGWPGGDR
ncbi:hypothetical protein LCGC14_1450130 [marine sediment metagenome]|uniref:Uncharacterized protein n=1 Tax=marine sediment metagenome TaxID=412755 RepID=A0A0F9K4E3_9ZZZZ